MSANDDLLAKFGEMCARLAETHRTTPERVRDALLDPDEPVAPWQVAHSASAVHELEAWAVLAACNAGRTTKPGHVARWLDAAERVRVGTPWAYPVPVPGGSYTITQKFSDGFDPDKVAAGLANAAPLRAATADDHLGGREELIMRYRAEQAAHETTRAELARVRADRDMYAGQFAAEALLRAELEAARETIAVKDGVIAMQRDRMAHMRWLLSLVAQGVVVPSNIIELVRGVGDQ